MKKYILTPLLLIGLSSVCHASILSSALHHSTVHDDSASKMDIHIHFNNHHFNNHHYNQHHHYYPRWPYPQQYWDYNWDIPYPAPAYGYQCITSAYGIQTCGYNCISSGTSSACAPIPQQHCIADAYGHVACGYNCRSFSYGVACAQSPNQNCLRSKNGEIICGENCKTRKDGSVGCYSFN